MTGLLAVIPFGVTLFILIFLKNLFSSIGRFLIQIGGEIYEKSSGKPAPEWNGWLLDLVAVVVVVAAVVAWAIGRRSARPAGGNIEDLKGEAEEVLRVLEDQKPATGETAEDVAEGAAEAARTADDEPEDEPAAEAAGEAEAEEAKAEAAKPKKSFGSGDDEASFLDTESSDPEIQLDLARAYISMGDKEAARVILEEVAANGSKEQQAEARKMLDLM